MVMRIGETADTFNSVVRGLHLNEVSPLHEDKLRGIEEDVLRFDLPHDHSIRLGTLHNGEYIFVVQEGSHILFSAHQLNKNPLRSGVLKTFLHKERGFPRSVELDVNEDAQFVCIPKDLAEGFVVDNKINYELIKETPEVERHIRCTRITSVE
jgi:hypothetical protein